MTTNKLFQRIARELPENCEIGIYIGRDDVGMSMHGGGELLGEFSMNVLPDVEAALLHALEICKGEQV